MFVGKNAVQSCNDDLEKYLENLKKYPTLTEKIKQLYKLSCLTSEDMRVREAIRRNVFQALSPYYRNCKVFIYGSTNNGFGTKGSDLDLLFLPSPEYCKSGAEEEVKEDFVPTLAQLHKREVSVAQLAELNEKNQLLFVRRVLRKFYHLFGKILFIPAKCPILNFSGSDRNSLLSCDLSCRNSLVVSNTDLLRFFGNIDQRVKPLVIILRFWAKALGIIQPQALSSYAFTLLVIFFLQNASPPILPSVNFLMEMSNVSSKVAGWEVSFIQDLNKVPKTENQNTEGELLKNFFSFFWNFDFVRNVVCIRTGRELLIEELKNSHIEGFQVSALCIQDPFDLSHNVGKNMKPNSLHHLKSSLLIAKEILKGDANRKMDSDTFVSLFHAESLNHKIKNKFCFQDSNSIQFMIYLNREMISSLGNEEYLLKNWYVKASEAILELLNYGLLMECEVIDKAGFILNKCIECKPDISKCQNCLLTIQCAVYDRVWVNRKGNMILPSISDTEEFSNAVLQSEHLLSKNIINSNPNLSCNEPIFWFVCRCYKTGFLQIPHLFVVLSPQKKCKEYFQVQKFLLSYIPKMVTEMLTRAN